MKKTYFLFILLFSTCIQAAPFEIKVHDELDSEEGESAIEVQSALYKPNSNSPIKGNIFLTRLEYAYGINAKNEVNFNVYTSRQGGDTYVNGGKIAHIYVPTHDEEGILHYGIKNEFNTVSLPYQATQRFYELTPIVAFQFDKTRITFNPTIDYYFSGNTDKTTFSPAIKLAYEIAHETKIGVEYYSEMGSVKHFTDINKRPDTAYLVLDKEIDHSLLQIGIGKGVNSTSDSWVLKVMGAISFGK